MAKLINKQSILKNKALILYKKQKCEICGESELCCLELHHIKDKKYNISQSFKILPTAILKLELNKCICVCANCHKKLHNKVITINNSNIK